MQALVLVNQALGFRAHDPETRAVEYLVEGADPATWQSRELRWTYKGWPEGSPDILMAKRAANGLGLAGNAAARARLEELARRLPDADSELWRFLGPNVEEAITLVRSNAEVAAKSFIERLPKDWIWGYCAPWIPGPRDRAARSERPQFPALRL